MSFKEQLREYVAAAFTGIWVESHEHQEALRDIAALCITERWTFNVWDIDRSHGEPGEPADPVLALRSLAAKAAPDSSVLLVLPNFHKFLASVEVLQCLANTLNAGKTLRTFVVVLAPVVQIPVELERQFVVLHHALPSRDHLRRIAEGVANEPGEVPTGDQLERLLDAAAGLTVSEAEGAFSLSLVRHNQLLPETVLELKTQSLKKSGLLTLHRGTERFPDVGGMEPLKTFCLQALGARQRGSQARARGVLLLGVPGTGKSMFAKCLGNETGRPTLLMDVGALLGSLVGQSEQNIRRALAVADAMQPCILFVDEIEKALSGVASSGQTDSGVSARVFGTLLTWLNDHSSDVFFIGTCNDISRLPPEFTRAERFDGVVFLDLPSTAEKAAIWELSRKAYELPSQDLPRTENWTGAEIRGCCRLAALLGISLVEAAKQVVPIAATAGEAVEKLRQWASGRCLSASVPGLYQRTGTAPADRRRVTRASTSN